PLDRALVLIFPGPGSATGEDLAELHLHGGRAVVRAVESALAKCPGLRAAEPGEFTRRALASGRIDLTEAEGLGDLLAAETEHQRKVALASAQGALSRAVDTWRTALLTIAARIEAALDFSDEDDVAPVIAATLADEAVALGGDIERLLAVPPVERLRDGLRVVIAGPPNSGKSTLFNAMADREAAIVSPIAGTTRDRIEAPVVRGGIAYVLIDTAGLVDTTDDPIEAIGVERAGRAIEAADIVLWLGDDPPPENALWIHARADMAGRGTLPPGRLLSTAAANGEGVNAVWAALGSRAAAMLPPPDQIAVNARQRLLLANAAHCLAECAGERDTLLIAEHIRLALSAFDRLTGRADVEAMLDTLFARFCVGK
ncbi:MAG: tRNA uridine-5-carboxymethylaminomethyl(34) synthesis GTPase MnmE, partial [Sphingomonas sp.]